MEVKDSWWRVTLGLNNPKLYIIAGLFILMKCNLSKQEIIEKVKQVFSKNASAEEIKKIKKLASSKNIKIGYNRKKFCRNCNNLFNSDNSQIRIKKGFKIIRCGNCGIISRYKLK